MAIDIRTQRSRRALLVGSMGAVAAVAAQAVARPLGAKAADTSIAYVNDENNQVVLSASSIRNGPGTGQGIGVDGYCDDSVGVRGRSRTNVGVRGDSISGFGMFAESQTDHALVTYSDRRAGVYGQSGSGIGVLGTSLTGRGGQFKGRKAQLRLQPSTSSTHPRSGARGDLFVDKQGRLWFCKGGTSWRQLA